MKTSYSLSLVLVGLVLLSMFQNCQPVGSAVGGKAISSSSSSSTGGGGGTTTGGGGGTTTGGTTLAENEVWFNTNVRTVFQTRCNSCHAEPRFVVGGAAGPLTIFNYSQMRPKLASAGGAFGNDLIRKVTNVIAHVGGNTCNLGVTANDPVCGKIIEWWQKEFPLSPTGKAGQLQFVSAGGLVSGWAMNPANPATKITVIFYRDNPANQGGVLLGQTIANATGFGAYDGSYFNFQIPANFIDNRTHTVYAYMDTATVDNQIPGTPISYAAFVLSAAGRTFYNNNIAGIVQNQCLTCHAFNIDSAFGNLVSPSPFGGGTATNNNFYQNASGNGHPVNGCAGTNLCQSIQQWWNTEFQ